MTATRLPRIAAVVMAAAALADAARAQTFQGIVLEDSSRIAVRRYPVALVQFLPRGEAVVARTKTDGRGLFQLAASKPGVYQLEFGDSLVGITYGPVDTVSGDTVLLRQYSVRPAADLPRQVLMEFHVEEPVKQITSRVRYPDKLRERGICGEVFAVFVVDTLGNADMETFRIVRSTDPLFSQAVRDGVARSRFKPARLHTRLVRQLVHQPFAFSITETSPFVTLEPRRDSLPPEPYLPHHSCLAQKR